MTICSLIRRVRPAFVGVAILAVPSQVFAYIGPGAGLSIVGSVLALVAAIIVGIFGFLWFPIRRLLRKRKQASTEESKGTDLDATEATSDAPHGRKLEKTESEA